jgi:hypothetical protein
MAALASRHVGQLIAVVVLILVCAGLILNARDERQRAHEDLCRNNLKMISLALAGYADLHKCYPPARILDDHGRPIHSWRAVLMPFFHYRFLEVYSLSEPWNSPNNKTYTDLPVPVFQCPSKIHPGKPCITNYVAVVGPETMWPGDYSATPDEVTNPDGILLVEYPDSRIPWCEPRDLTVDEFVSMLESRWSQGDFGPHPSGLLYVTVRGDVRALDRHIDLTALRKLLRPRNNSAIVRDSE